MHAIMHVVLGLYECVSRPPRATNQMVKHGLAKGRGAHSVILEADDMQQRA